jgi:hypothetical protein
MSFFYFMFAFEFFLDLIENSIFLDASYSYFFEPLIKFFFEEFFCINFKCIFFSFCLNKKKEKI